MNKNKSLADVLASPAKRTPDDRALQSAAVDRLTKTARAIVNAVRYDALGLENNTALLPTIEECVKECEVWRHEKPVKFRAWRCELFGVTAYFAATTRNKARWRCAVDAHNAGWSKKPVDCLYKMKCRRAPEHDQTAEALGRTAGFAV
ncbi:MAG: hypothetical protein WC551_08545 [Patescibacteria group bacterium]